MTGQTRWTKLSNPQGTIPNGYPTRLVCVLEMPISFLERKRDMNLPKNVHMSVVVHECVHECVCVCPGPRVDTAGRGAVGHMGSGLRVCVLVWSILMNLVHQTLIDLDKCLNLLCRYVNSI